MGWASYHIQALARGEAVKFHPTGKSMTGRIESGQLVTVVPVTEDTYLGLDDIVLCTVNGNQYLHLVKHVSEDGECYTIGNNKGGVNGTVTRSNIHGKCIKVEP